MPEISEENSAVSGVALPGEKPQLWLCPACQQALRDEGLSVVCDAGHRYDRARQGYLNLLLANQKHSLDPGDNRDMVDARREFLSAGHYDFLFAMLCEVLATHLNTDDATMCDLGCGEGSYLRAIGQQFPCVNYWGCDISKHAVKRAATWVKPAQLCVASTYHVPLQSHSQGVLLSVFSPTSVDEITRLLSPRGVFVRVSPAEKHLLQLKRALYREAHEHEAPKPLPGYTRKTLLRVGETAELDVNDLANLIGMTPLNWRGDAAGKERLLNVAPTPMQFDFIIEVFTRD